MAKYDYEFRLKVMKSYLKGEGGILSLQKIQYTNYFYYSRWIL
ncbi:hypothetical protein NSA24_02310 [Clostridioides mangenotii]|nr:hypothetical protein [Clostridioides mangenotii]